MLILGHRGASAIAPENTVFALRAALEAGAAGSEFDVRMTADGACVCTHDAIVRDGDRERRVCDLTASEVASLTGAPALAEALDALDGSLALVELKNHPWDACFDPTNAMAAIVAAAVPEDAVIACFDPATVAAVRAARPGVRTAVITSAAFDPLANLEAALAGGHEICSVEHHAITAAFVERAHAARREVYAWATDEPTDVRRLRDAGVDGLMCDDPARALAAL